MEQLSLFDTLWEKYTIKKPIRLIELFAGYGSQHLALKYLGANFESHRIAEWAVKSIQAYKDLHCPEDHTNYGANLTQEELTDYLFNKGISMDYNAPMAREQIARLGIEREREIYNNIVATKNLVSVCNIHAQDLNIENKDKYEYIMTYSFPCQDLSLAGKTQGMKKGSGTRSGLLWEVERILNELKARNELPQILLMENVTQVHGEKNWADFEAWKKALTQLGYCNFWKDLIATDYGVPQTRDRTFMVSILGDYNYNFPKPIKLEKRLRDLLEEDVPEKYFLSDAMMEYIVSKDDKYKVGENNLVINREIACSKTTREGSTRADASDYISEDAPQNTKLKIKEKPSKHLEQILAKNEIPEGISFIDGYNKTIKQDGLSATICCKNPSSADKYIAFKKTSVPLKRGYSVSVKEEQEDTEEIDVVGNYSKSNFTQTSIVGKNGVAPTVTENHGQVTAIPIKNATKQGYLLAELGDGVDISGRMESHRGTVQKGKAQTLSTMGGGKRRSGCQR